MQPALKGSPGGRSLLVSGRTGPATGRRFPGIPGLAASPRRICSWSVNQANDTLEDCSGERHPMHVPPRCGPHRRRVNRQDSDACERCRPATFRREALRFLVAALIGRVARTAFITGALGDKIKSDSAVLFHARVNGAFDDG